MRWLLSSLFLIGCSSSTPAPSAVGTPPAADPIAVAAPGPDPSPGDRPEVTAPPTEEAAPTEPLPTDGAPYTVSAYSQEGSVPSAEPPTMRVDAEEGRLRVRLASLNTFCAPQPTFALEQEPGSRLLTLHLLHPDGPSRCVGPHSLTLLFPVRADSIDRVELRGEESELLVDALRAGVEP